jgi:hypothetical protein
LHVQDIDLALQPQPQPLGTAQDALLDAALRLGDVGARAKGRCRENPMREEEGGGAALDGFPSR